MQASWIASATVTPSSGSPESAAYAYDQSGNLESVTGSAAPAGGQTLSWDDAGRLSQVTTASGTARYLYDADGKLLIQQDAPAAGDGDATSTLYLGDEQIVADNIGGVTVAARTSTGTLDYLDGDVQGTASLAVNVSTLALTRRFYDPYGNPVGLAASWPGTRGFVGGPADPLSTLDDLGAREYQPATGTFTSADSVLTPYNPQDLDPYAYAADDPATQSDPTGLCPTGPMGEPLNCNSTPVGTPAGSGGSGGGDTGTAGSTGGGGGCGFLGLGCAWHATADFAGGAATGATSAFAGPIAEMEAEMVNSFPTGVTATGGLEYGNDVSASSMTTWHVGDPGSPLYKAAYYAAYYAAPLAAGAGAGADAAVADAGQADTLRAAVEQQYQEVVAGQSIRVRGPVLSGAMDTRTGDIFFGQNTGIPDPLAPQLRSAIDEFEGPEAPGKGIPGAHSEINAVNQGLLTNPGSQISDYIFYNVRLRGALQGEPIEMCPNCAGILGQ
jgi:RHS repeat-associated protein